MLSVGHVGLSDLLSSRHMYIYGQIDNKNLTALVDTGASGFAFASKSLCDRLNLSPNPLSSAIALVGFEEKRKSFITQKVSIRLSLSNHVEILSAYVIDTCKYELILGLPWLEKHKPYVDWKDHTITFGEPCLARGCSQFETTIPYSNSKTLPETFVHMTQEALNTPEHKNSQSKPFKPTKISASKFDLTSRQHGTEFFALSLPDLGRLEMNLCKD